MNIRKASVATAAFMLAATGPVFAAENFNEHAADYVKAMPSTKHTLSEAIQAAAKNGEVPTVAKYEVEDGKLIVNVYTSQKGLKTDADQNVLKEYNADPTQATLAPQPAKVFADPEHVARAAEYHALMASSPTALLDIAKRAEGEGQVLWVQPRVIGGKAVFDVGVLKAGKVDQVRYGMTDGKKLVD